LQDGGRLFFLILQVWRSKVRKIMVTKIARTASLPRDCNTAFVVKKESELPREFFTAAEMAHIRRQKTQKKQDLVRLNRLSYWVFLVFIPDEKQQYLVLESCRKTGDRLQGILDELKEEALWIVDAGRHPDETLAMAEGALLGSYRFRKYRTREREESSLKKITLVSPDIPQKETDWINAAAEGVFFARDMINEPNSTLTATAFSREIEKRATASGIRMEILNKKKLESLKMGGILGVNRGSHEPPVLITLQWKPPKPVNRKPYVLVGKGVMFDTGGMNLKPGDFMNNMKDDMSGGAAVAGTLLALARAKFPLHVIGLIPATDNRPGEQALVSGDVIRMHDGTMVEVINTDAEGRLILADALSYAKKYNPTLVIDLATLTGAASRAIGKNGMAGMQSRAEVEFERLRKTGYRVYERIVEFPLWPDYAESLKSEIADLRNLGGTDAGAITAGKFLEHFTDYPYIHLDIAGPAYLEKKDAYRGPGGTGVGIRLIFEYLKTQLSK
jgi:leucyl aminopeptidase